MKDNIRVAILGCGKMNRAHVKGFLALQDECTVTVAVDVNLERAKEVAEMTGGKAATSLDGLWDEFDAIDICTPHNFHAEHTIEALRRGKHVLVEKPMATNPEDAQRMVDVAEETRNVLMIGYVLRYHPLIQKLIDVVHSNEYGRPLFAHMATEDYYKPHTDWLRWNYTRGGGVLFSHGCHYIDLLIALFGPVRRATSMRNKLIMHELEGEESAIALCEFTTGVIGTYTASQATKHGRHGLTTSINCEHGRIELDLRAGELVVYQNNERTVLAEGGSHKPIEEQILHFLDCIREGKQPITSGRSTMASLNALYTMYEADREDRIARCW